ncbi:MAG: STAS domain-containing protein [Clostridia bacterium]|nr:STAS domain-containing protein [Clostridia bacterium]
MIKSNCRYRFTATPEGLVVSVTGEIDHHSASSMRREVDNIIWNRTPTHLILDMSEVDFMDSSGLGFIMGRYALMKEIGGSLSLRNPSAIVMKMLTLTGFDKKVRIMNTVFN